MLRPSDRAEISALEMEMARRAAPREAFRGGLRAFRRDEKGTIAIIFALTSFIVMALVGGAVDYGRAVTARDQMQNACDASVLAAARVWQTEKSLTLAEQKATEYYESNKPHGVDSSISAFESNLERNSITLSALSRIKAPFLSAAAAISVLAGGASSTQSTDYVVTVKCEALLAAGGNGDSDLEIAMMLDVTGSMSGDKIKDLKAAAKDLIDIVVWADQSEHTSRVALVPFANAVNLGSTDLAEAVRGEVKSSYCQSQSSPCTGVGTGNSKWQWGRPAKWYKFKNQAGNDTTWQVSSYCVTERVASTVTDDAPDLDSTKVGPLYSDTKAASCGDMVLKTSDLEVNTVQPLTNDKELLKRRIDKLTINGSTAGQIGSAWAWYMLSPKWGYLWPDNQPVAYHTEKTDKIAILMTDGEYNTAHCNGVLAKDSGYGDKNNRINCNATNGKSDSQADDVCAAMKEGTGITVYTVGFALGGNKTAIDTLKKCASDETKFYDAEDGDQLRMAFRDIALQVAKLRLSH